MEYNLCADLIDTYYFVLSVFFSITSLVIGLSPYVNGGLEFLTVEGYFERKGYIPCGHMVSSREERRNATLFLK